MAIQDKPTLVSYFPNGATPEGFQFEDLIDTLVAIDKTSAYFGAGSIPLSVIGATTRSRISDTELALYTNGGVPVARLTENGVNYGGTDYLKTVYETVSGWDMLANAGFAWTGATSYLTRENVRSIQVLVVADSDDSYGQIYDPKQNSADDLYWEMNKVSTNGTISFYRKNGGTFDSTNFNGSGERLRLVITYDPTP